MKKWQHNCGMKSWMRPIPNLGDCINHGTFQIDVFSFVDSHRRPECSETLYVCGWHLARGVRLLRYGCLGHKHGAMSTDLVRVEVTTLDKVSGEE